MLLLDIGNSRIKWAVTEGRTLARTGAIPHQGDQSIPALLAREWDGIRPDTIHGISVAAPSVWRSLCHWCHAHWRLLPRRITSPPADDVIRIAYADPARLGVDRWAAMTGGRARCSAPFLVIDCGTATTLDLVDESGRHLGGLITAGLDTLRAALGQRAHQLARADAGVVAVLATDTATAIRSGTLLGQAAALDGLIERIGDASPELQPVVLMTGGDAADLAARMKRPAYHHPHLVLEGLADYLTRSESR